MKKYAVIITCLALSAPFARSQATPSGQSQSSAQNPSQPSSSERSVEALPGPRSSSSTSGVSPGATATGSQTITNGAGPGTFGAGSAVTQTSDVERNNSSTSSAADRGTINDPSGASRQTGLGTPPLTAGRTVSSASEKGNASTASSSSSITSGTGISSPSSNPSVYGKGSTSSTNSIGGSPGSREASSSTTAGGIVTEPSGASTESASDRSLTQKLRQSLNTEGSTTVTSKQNNEGLNITSRNGVVTIRGNVKNEGQKRSIEARLKNVDGVVSINNELKVSDKRATSSDSSVSSTPEDRDSSGSRDFQNKGSDAKSSERKIKSSQD